MSIALDQPDDGVVKWRHPDNDDLMVVSVRGKYDLRDGGLILREWWPSSPDALREAAAFLEGYGMAKAVWRRDR